MPRYQPTDLHALVAERAGALGSVEFLSRRKHQRLREMWCAATFGLGYRAHLGECLIDMDEKDEQREYDFHLVLPRGSPLPFQVTEVLDPARRRSAEYLRMGKPAVDRMLDALPFRGSSYAARRLHAALGRKAAKRYAGSTQLHVLAYLNIQAGNVTWAALSSASEAAAKQFASVWVVTDQLFACLHGGKHWQGLVGWRTVASAA